MDPSPWTAFTFFGIPLVLGLLGGVHGLRMLWRAYLQRLRPAEKGTDRADVALAVVLLVGSALLVAHSGRWLVTVYP